MSETVDPHAAAPAWFVDALAHEPEHRSTDVGGVSIAYRVWGDSGLPVVVLVHGGAAHAGWWDHVAPFLAPGHRVVAIDLSGHGDSGHRAAYDLATWADEVMAVAAAEGSDRPAVLGHSMGGFVTLTAAVDPRYSLLGAAAIDSPVRAMSSEARAWMDKHPTLPPHKIHPTREAVEARFKTLPSDGATLEYVRAHVASGSVREVEGGWSWKFDPLIFFSTRMEPEELVAAPGPIALVRGERGMATVDITESVAALLGGDVPVTLIPDSGHHIMLDQPLALIAVLQTLIGEWSRP